MIFCFDIDETICSKVATSNYEAANPFKDVVGSINSLYDEGHKIIIMSARGSVSKKDFSEFTKNQLSQWGVKYHQLLMNIKPNADIFVDDKGMNVADFKKKYINKKVGFVAGGFDIIHPGYIRLFKEAKEYCNYLIVGLHEDPTLEEKDKIKLTLTVEERRETLLSIRYIDKVVVYRTEKELYNLLKKTNIDIRFLGDDYRREKITGFDLKIPIHFCSREHGWSSTRLKCLIGEKNEKFV